MEEFQKEGVDPEEKQQEEELLKEIPADEIHTSIIDKYGLDEEIDKELIEKLVEDRLESGKKLSTAIKQKIGWRTKATAQTEQKKEEKPHPQFQPAVFDEKVIDQKMDEKLEERELQSLDISDELKQKVKAYAKVDGLTIKQVLQTDYFKYLKDQEDAKIKVDEAAIGGKRRAPTRKDFGSIKPTEFDLSTEEGQKEYEEYKSWRKESRK